MDLIAPQGYKLLNHEEWIKYDESKIHGPYGTDVLKKENTDNYIIITQTEVLSRVGELNFRNKGHIEQANNILRDDRFGVDMQNNVRVVPKKYLKKINADTALIRLLGDSRVLARHRDTVSYNSKNYSFLYVTLVKYDLGAIWLRYNYETGKLKQAIKEVYKTWGIATFRPDSTMKRHPKDSITIYTGKFSHLNTPQVLKRDSIAIAKLLAKDPYQLEDKIMYANVQLYSKNYDGCIKITDQPIALYESLLQQKVVIKNPKNTQRQIASFYYLKAQALLAKQKTSEAKQALQKAKEMGYQLSLNEA